MNVTLRIYEAEGFQEDGANAPVTYLEALAGNGDDLLLTLGRFFTTDPELLERLGLAEINLVIEDERVRASV